MENKPTLLNRLVKISFIGGTLIVALAVAYHLVIFIPGQERRQLEVQEATRLKQVALQKKLDLEAEVAVKPPTPTQEKALQNNGIQEKMVMCEIENYEVKTTEGQCGQVAILNKKAQSDYDKILKEQEKCNERSVKYNKEKSNDYFLALEEENLEEYYKEYKPEYAPLSFEDCNKKAMDDMEKVTKDLDKSIDRVLK